MLGTNIIVGFTYFLAKFPDTYIYPYTTFIMISLLSHRYYTFWVNDYHMYLVDFCYIANFCLLIYINFARDCQWLLVTSFVFGNGVLASAVLAFRNSLVYHKMDMLCSLAIHSVPMIITLHIKWYTIPN